MGAPAAGPLLFDLLESLGSSKPAPPVVHPKDLSRVTVCAVSGRVPGPACEVTRRALALRAHVPTEPCPFHVRADIDAVSGLRLTPACRKGKRFETRSFVAWPSSVRRWMKESRRRLPELPELALGCSTAEGTPPAIVSPPSGQIAELIPGMDPGRQSIPLEAEASKGKLSWFVDGVFLGTCAAETRMWWQPKPGTHEILVVDESGSSSRRSLEVRVRSM